MKILISAFGKDKPGIVTKISKIITEYKCNIIESRMMKIENDFTVMMLVDIYKEKNKLINKLESISELKFLIKESSLEADNLNDYNATITLSGADNIGIVHSVSDILTNHSINIIDMNTSIVNVPNTGTPIFNMETNIFLDNNVSTKELMNEIENLAIESDIEISIVLKS